MMIGALQNAAIGMREQVADAIIISGIIQVHDSSSIVERLDIEQVVFHTGQLRIEMEIVVSDERVEIQFSPRYSNSGRQTRLLC